MNPTSQHLRPLCCICRCACAPLRAAAQSPCGAGGSPGSRSCGALLIVHSPADLVILVRGPAKGFIPAHSTWCRPIITRYAGRHGSGVGGCCVCLCVYLCPEECEQRLGSSQPSRCRGTRCPDAPTGCKQSPSESGGAGVPAHSAQGRSPAPVECGASGTGPAEVMPLGSSGVQG